MNDRGHFADQREYAVRFEWGVEGLRAIGAGAEVVIVVDVLSFTTTVEVAAARGAVVYPHRWKDAAAETRAAELGAVAAGARGKAKYSLSPGSVLGVSAGEKIVLASPNGAMVSLEAAEMGAKVVAACWRNATTVARYAAEFGQVAVIAAGERWGDGSPRMAVEDMAAAGAVIEGLSGRGRSPEAEAAAAVAEELAPRLEAALRECASGRQLIEMGYAEDVGMAAQVNVSECVPVLRDGAFERARA